MIIDFYAIISIGNVNLLILIDHYPTLRNDVLQTWVLLKVIYKLTTLIRYPRSASMTATLESFPIPAISLLPLGSSASA